MATIEIQSPSLTGRTGVAGGRTEGIILSAVVVSDGGKRGGFGQVRMQGKNSRGKLTKDAWQKENGYSDLAVDSGCLDG